MTPDDFSNEIEKIKYQLRIVGQTINCESHPVEALVLSMDLAEEDIDRAHDIFEKYDKKIDKKEMINWHEFEHELEDAFGIGYQTVKEPLIKSLAVYNLRQGIND